MVKNVLKEIADKCKDEIDWAQGNLDDMLVSGECDEEDRVWTVGWIDAHRGILDMAKKGVV